MTNDSLQMLAILLGAGFGLAFWVLASILTTDARYRRYQERAARDR